MSGELGKPLTTTPVTARAVFKPIDKDRMRRLTALMLRMLDTPVTPDEAR